MLGKIPLRKPTFFNSLVIQPLIVSHKNRRKRENDENNFTVLLKIINSIFLFNLRDKKQERKRKTWSERFPLASLLPKYFQQ